MIVATRLSAVWQVAGVAGAALCCYLVSQSVAAERAGLLKVDHQISQTHDEIAKLHTEIGVRGRMGQLERWNTEVLALQAPRPSQFVSDGVQLASLYGRKGQPALQLDPAIVRQQGDVTRVAYAPPVSTQAPAMPVAAAPAPRVPEITPAQPLLRTATYIRPVPDRMGPAVAGSTSGQLIAKVSFQPGKPLVKPASLPAVKPIPTAKLAPVVKVAFQSPKSLLPADISLLAAREAKGSKDSAKAAR